MSKVATQYLTTPIIKIINNFINDYDVDIDLLEKLLDRLPDSDVCKLKKIYLIDCNLDILPNISKLTALQNLDFSQNSISTFPDSISKLSELISVKLQENEISKIPASIDNLLQLFQLKLDNIIYRYVM